MSLADFDLFEQLGEGAYSVVFRVQRKSDQQVYALKKVRMLGLKDKEQQNSLNEVRILASLDHPNIIAYKEAFVDAASNSLWYAARSIVMEFADAGDLLQKVTQLRRQGSHLPEAEIWRLFLHLTKGLRALHALQILHRDLKSANVFLFKDGRVKLGDMNVSKVAKLGLVYTQTGTPYYASPEVWRDQPYDLKSDIWSLGCVLYEAAALQPPFRAADMNSLYRKVMKGDFPPLPVFYSQDLYALLRTMLQVSPTLRPTCDKLLLLPVVGRNLRLQTEDFAQETQDLLGTIRVPRQLISLHLPAPAYSRKARNSSLPLCSKKSLFRPNPLTSMSVPEEQHPASGKLPALKPILSPVLVPSKQVSLAHQIEAIRAKYDRVRPGIFQPRPTATRSTVQPAWWG